jgi:Xaa-Pro aminopeptidase
VSGNTPAERLESFSKRLSDAKIDSAIISDPRHIFYFTGFSTYKSRINSFLLVDSLKEEHTLFVGHTEERAAGEVFSGKLEIYQDYDIKKGMVVYPDIFSKLFRNLSRDKGIGKTVGIEEWHLPGIYLQVLKGRKIGISKTILSMRRKKGKDELTRHQEAAKRLDRAYKIATTYQKTGRTEMQLYRHINSLYFEKEGAVEPQRYSNVLGDFVSGKRTLEIGGPATENRMLKDSTLIMDLQASFDNYWADTARTLMVGSAPTIRQKQIFETLLHAKRQAEKILRPGTKGSEVYAIVSQAITKAGFNPLPHHAGHGVGLDSQEAPFFIPGSEDVIEEGDLCALEPGIYDKEAGGMRIEDNYVITDDGFKKTSHFPLSLA